MKIWRKNSEDLLTARIVLDYPTLNDSYQELEITAERVKKIGFGTGISTNWKDLGYYEILPTDPILNRLVKLADKLSLSVDL